MNKQANRKIIAQKIDHTLLKPDAGKKSIKKLCMEAVEYNFAAVCVLPYWVKKAAELLKNSKPSVCTVIGFPLGANLTETKLTETESALNDGAAEIDMVMNLPAFFDRHFEYVETEIKKAAALCYSKGAVLKIIIETAMLSREQKITACNIVSRSGADFIKTSTGFSKEGANVDDILLMKETIDEKIKIKASGGIKSADFTLKLINAGADRIGTSSGMDILKAF